MRKVTGNVVRLLASLVLNWQSISHRCPLNVDHNLSLSFGDHRLNLHFPI